MSKKLDERDWSAEDIQLQQLRRGLEMTPAERLHWLEETMAELRPLVGRARWAPRVGEGSN